MQEVEKGKALVPRLPANFGAAAFGVDDAREWQEWHEYSQQDYNRYEYALDEDDEVRPLLLSSIASESKQCRMCPVPAPCALCQMLHFASLRRQALHPCQ